MIAMSAPAPAIPNWSFDGDSRTWNIRVAGVHIWIEKRPHYCDRGHFIGKVQGIASIDAADLFPRYYMDVERAKGEMRDWLIWRLQREAATE